MGQMYVFPDWVRTLASESYRVPKRTAGPLLFDAKSHCMEVQTLTYPFEGSGERRWIAATVALSDAKSARPPEDLTPKQLSKARLLSLQPQSAG